MADVVSRKYNADHLSSNNLYQVQQTNWFEIFISSTLSGSGFKDGLFFLVNSCNLPEISNPAIDLPYGNSTAKVAGKNEYGDNTVSFMDAIQLDVENEMRIWQRQIYDPSKGTMGWVQDYKRTMTITEYGPDGTNLRVWEFTGVWPSSVTYGELSNESPDKKSISVTLTFDKADRVDTSTKK